jgi:hypothetical protein
MLKDLSEPPEPKSLHFWEHHRKSLHPFESTSESLSIPLRALASSALSIYERHLPLLSIYESKHPYPTPSIRSEHLIVALRSTPPSWRTSKVNVVAFMISQNRSIRPGPRHPWCTTTSFLWSATMTTIDNTISRVHYALTASVARPL